MSFPPVNPLPVGRGSSFLTPTDPLGNRGEQTDGTLGPRDELKDPLSAPGTGRDPPAPPGPPPGPTLPGSGSRSRLEANLVLHQTVERIHVGKKYGDIPRGIFVVRGENVVLLGEIDLEKESDTPLQQVSIEEILEEQRVEQQAKQESEKLKVQALKERGLSVPRADTLDEY
ncbi:PREDICTED: U6 snRNA-associated Sm-like protein LSm1 [Chaetura pelagica]|uniref:U6 snRNA-associated Sm-like protein LSm1 n=1 Tax=Chaetura pelagica TaxID=8897 RepID=UPI000523C69D|nr:PREDICTED: U6 snRNA-associated Sm-like protein LSm1 [Chaetura pelagica]